MPKDPSDPGLDENPEIQPNANSDGLDDFDYQDDIAAISINSLQPDQPAVMASNDTEWLIDDSQGLLGARLYSSRNAYENELCCERATDYTHTSTWGFIPGSLSAR
ncbi:unnamed protein product [Clonostachys chloroleuca]|uniref:Uncharacterized protein n=1 Tax=Clonostachys chloroleuca TaxID=1926264 RepID=A0AA35M572_9HYPO|nr:unnamed protein product [Clonostachys chloroleuca]